MMFCDTSKVWKEVCLCASFKHDVMVRFRSTLQGHVHVHVKYVRNVHLNLTKFVKTRVYQRDIQTWFTPQPVRQ